MMKQWFTALELSSFQLPSLPTTQQNIVLRAKKSDWKKRSRNAVGGGYEYHLSNLPAEAQAALVQKLAGTPAIAIFEPEMRITNDDRRNARIIIVTLFEQFLETSLMPVMRAEAAFMTFYRAEASRPDSIYVPGWVGKMHPQLAERTLRRWRATQDKAALKPKYGNRHKTGLLDRAHDGEVGKYILSLITAKTHLNGGHVRDLVRSKFGSSFTMGEKVYPLPTVRSFERWIAAWKNDNGDMWLRLTDPDGYKNQTRVSFGRADAGIERLNQLWEIDASPVDALCVDGRYNLYAVIDVWSRRALFLVTKTPRTEASLTLIRRAIMEWGVPEAIKTDNGSDFTSKRFQGAIMSLGIAQKLCTPYSPEQKPHVERVIQTLQHDLMPLLPGYVGHSVADRKKIEAVKAFNQRLGLDEKEALAIEMDHEALQDHIDTWAVAKYQHQPHAGINTSPFQKAASSTDAIRRIESERALDLLLAPIASGDGTRRVGKKGIRIENGLFIAIPLGLYVGKTVFVRHDPRDLGRIYVFDDKNEFICVAEDPRRTGIDPQAISIYARAKQKAKGKDEIREIRAAQRKMKPADYINGYLKHHIENSENITPLPKREEIHSSPSLQEAAKATRPYTPPEPTPKSEREILAEKKLLQRMEAQKQEAARPVDLFDKSSRDGRKNLMFGILRRLENNQHVPDHDQRWLESYQKTPEYRSNLSAYRQFGELWFKGDINYEPQ